MAVKLCGIYKIANPNKGVYIGQSRDINKRINAYRYCKKSQRRLYNSLQKYGFDKHTFEIVCLCDEADLDRLEAYYISLYNTFNTSHGLNLLAGGHALARHSEESKRKMSESRKGVKCSEERKAKLRGKRGKQNHVRTAEHIKKLTIPKSDATKEKLRKAHLGKKHSLEHRKAQSEARKNMSEEIKDKYRKPWTPARWEAYYNTKNKTK